METEFIYWPHPTPPGIRVEEVSGMENKSGKLWREMALQIYCENGRDNFREIGHFQNGAPFLFGIPSRISLTHTCHLLAVASLPKTPEADLSRFNTRTALGIDAESLERTQVLKVRERFLSQKELEMIPADSLEQNIIAWTAKEALYKAAMTEGLDFRTSIVIDTLPQIDRHMNMPGSRPVYGKAHIFILVETEIAKDSAEEAASRLEIASVEMELYSYDSDGYCVTLAYSPKCAKFSRGIKNN